MTLMAERTEAQLRQVLLYLEGVESRSVSLGMSAPQHDVPAAVSRLLEEVSTIEQMYREMDGQGEPAAENVAAAECVPADIAGIEDPQEQQRGRDPESRVKGRE